MLDWNDLRYFLVIAKEGTLARAAARLGINQSTVYRRLTVLEAELEVSLVERRGRGYVLTAAGESLVAYVNRMEDEVHAIERHLLGSDRKLAGVVRVTTTDTLGCRLLAPHFEAFRAAYPGIQLDVYVDNRFFHLGQGEADVAIRPGPKPTDGEVVARRLSSVAGAFYASASYVARRGRPGGRKDLASHDLISVDESLAHLTYARLIAEVAERDRVVYRCTSLLGQVAAVEAGIGVAALPCFLMDSVPDIERLFAPEPELETELWLLTHPDLRQNARVRAFIDHMTAAIEGERDLLEGRRPKATVPSSGKGPRSRSKRTR